MNNCGVGFADILYIVRFANSIIINYSFFHSSFELGGLKRTRTSDLTLIRRAL